MNDIIKELEGIDTTLESWMAINNLDEVVWKLCISRMLWQYPGWKFNKHGEKK